MDTHGNQEKIHMKFNQIQQEIMAIGWNGILDKYHPDANLDDENAFDLFNLYKEIYSLMQKRLQAS